MSAEGQTIPDDIMRSAEAALNEAVTEPLKVDAYVVIAKSILAERERNAQPRKKIIEAMCELPHSIDNDRVVFRFNPRRPGHNALNQVLTQLEAQVGASREEA